MRLDFKKGLSFVLALVMMVSALTVVNVSSVMAAEQKTWDFSESPWNTYTTAKKVYTYDGLTIVHNGASGVSPYQKLNSNDNNPVTTTDKPYISFYCDQEDIVTVYYTANSDNKTVKLCFAPSANPNDNNAQRDSKEVSKKGTFVSSQFTVKTEGTYYLTASSGSDTFVPQKIIKSPGDVQKTTWKFNPDNFDESKEIYVGKLFPNLQGDKAALQAMFSFANTTETAAAHNGLAFSGDGYTLNPNYAALDASGSSLPEYLKKEGNTVTVTITKDMLLENVTLNKENIKVQYAPGKIVHFECKDHGKVFSVLLSETGDDDDYYSAEYILKPDGNGGYTKSGDLTIPIHTDTFTASMGGGDLTQTEFKVENSESSFTSVFNPYDLDSITASVPKTTFENLKTLSGGAGERIKGGTVLDTAKHFFVLGSKYNNVYKLSGLVGSEDLGEAALAIVLRARHESGSEEHGGIGFTLAGEDIVGKGTTFDVTVNCVAVKDRQNTSEGDISDTQIALAEYDKSLSKLSEDTAQKKSITAHLDPKGGTDDTTTNEDIKFTGLEPGKTYGIYHPAEEDQTQGNIRIYSIEVTMNTGASTEAVQILPTSTGYTLENVYTDERVLIDSTAKPEDYNGAYSAIKQDSSNSGDKASNYVKVNADGLTLMDTSKATTELYLPLLTPLSDGKVTFKGSLKNGVDVGGKWSPLDFGNGVSIRITSSSSSGNDYIGSAPAGNKFALAVEGKGDKKDKFYYKETNTAVSKTFTKIDYTVVFDFSENTVSLTIGDDTVEYKTSELDGYDKFDTISALKSVTAAKSETRTVTLGNIEITKENAVPKITGSVIAKDSLENKDHTNHKDLAMDDKQDTSNYVNNTSIEGSTTSTPLSDAKVTITGGSYNNQEVTIDPDGSFTFDDDGKGIDDGKYTVTAKDSSNKLIGTKTVEVKQGVAISQADFVVDKSVEVTLTTDIKDFGDDIVLTSKTNSAIKIKINDKTYHHIKGLVESMGDTARVESITHYFKAPAGKYTVSCANANFEIQDRQGTKIDELEIGKDGVSKETVRLYLAPAVTTTEVGWEAKAKDLSPVQRGIYRFIRQSDDNKDTVQDAAIKYKSAESDSFTDDSGHMYGAGKYSQFKTTTPADGFVPGDKDGRISIEKGADGGFVVFKLAAGDDYIAKIKISNTTCILKCVEGDGKINSSRDIVSVDSRFDTTAISISGGKEGATFVLYTNSNKAANVESIEFDVASPFAVTETKSLDDDETLSNAKLVVGKFSMDGIDEDAFNNYSAFAILVSKNKDALKWAAINGTISDTHKPTDDPNPITSSTDDQSISADGGEKHETNGHKTVVPIDDSGTNNADVFRDETTEVFKRILDDTGKPLVEADGNYYYGVVVENVDSTLYAVGAAKSSENGKWTIQSGDPVTISAE